MRDLGIDPGTRIMGYGVVDGTGDEMRAVEYGTLTADLRADMAKRLRGMYDDLNAIIQQFHPDELAVEQPFVSRNVRSAMAIGRAQAVALLAAAGHDIPAYEYSPASVKQSVASYGASSKEQVQEMVRLQLGLAERPEPNDAADALAVAICHLREVHLRDLVCRQGEA